MEGGPPGFRPGFTCPAVLGYRLMRGARCRVRGSHPVPPAFPCRSATKLLCNRIPGRQTRGGRPRNTTRSNACRLTRAWVWAGALSLAATRAISVDFSSSGYLDVSVPRVASAPPMCSAGGTRAWPRVGSPIRTSADPGPYAPPRGLSQLVTSFVGFLCQGIRRAPLTSSHKTTRLFRFRYNRFPYRRASARRVSDREKCESLISMLLRLRRITTVIPQISCLHSR